QRHQETAGKDLHPINNEPAPKARLLSVFVEDADALACGPVPPVGKVLRPLISRVTACRHQAGHGAAPSPPGVCRGSTLSPRADPSAPPSFFSRMLDKLRGMLFTVVESDDEPRHQPAETKTLVEPQRGIFGVPLKESITYANVAISLIDENGDSYIYGY